MLLTPRNESRPRTSSLQKTNDINHDNRVIKTLPPENFVKKEFVIKSSKDRRTPDKRIPQPIKKSLQTLFKKEDEEEEKDFLDLLNQLK